MKNDIKKEFGKKVKQFRLELGISQEELAFRAGLHRTYISDLERGNRNVSLETINKIADGLKIKISQLMQI